MPNNGAKTRNIKETGDDMILQKYDSVYVEFKNEKYYLDLNSMQETVTLRPKGYTQEYFVDDSNDEFPYFVIYVTDLCNMKCSYCFNEMDKSEKNCNKLPLYSAEDFCTFVNRNYFNKEIGIRFFGGEPLLNKQWIYEFVKKLEKEEIKVSYDIFTNATLLDDEFLEFAKKYKIRFYVSINGGLDVYKGRYFKEDIWGNIRKLRKQGFPVITRMVWNPNVQETLTDLIVQAVENGVKTISFTLPWGEILIIIFFLSSWRILRSFTKRRL